MVLEPLWLSIRLAAITTVILLVVGAPLAYALAFGRFRFKGLIEAFVALPLVLPPTVLGYYLLTAFGAQGALGKVWTAVFHQPLAFSFAGLVLASIAYSLPFAVQPMQAAFETLNPRMLEAAWTLGASRTATFFKVVLPASGAGVAAAGVLTFTHTLGEFGVVLMVGGNIPGVTRTVSIAVYDLVEAFAYDEAGRLSAVLLVLSYGVLALFYAGHRRWRWRWLA